MGKLVKHKPVEAGVKRALVDAALFALVVSGLLLCVWGGLGVLVGASMAGNPWAVLLGLLSVGLLGLGWWKLIAFVANRFGLRP